MKLVYGKHGSKKSVVRVTLAAGSGVESGHGWTPGIAHIAEHMMFQGSRTMSHDDLAKDMARLGVRWNAYTSHHRMSFFVDAPEDNVVKAARMLSDMLLERKFDKDLFENEKRVVLEEERGSRDDIESIIWEDLTKFLCRGPLAMPVIGTEESIGKVSLDELQDFYDNFYRPERMLLTVTKSDEDGVREIADMFGGDDGKFLKWHVEENKFAGGKRRTVRGKVQQARVAICYRSLPIGSRKITELSCLEKFFSNGADSRLFRVIRQEKGLCYSVGSSHYLNDDASWFIIWVETGEKSVKKVIKLVDEEVLKLLEKGPDSEEMERARNKYLSEIYGYIETSYGMNSMLDSVAFHNLPDLDKKLNRIRKTTAGKVVAACHEVFVDSGKQVFTYLPEKDSGDAE
jgi:predicted Zn-dependent peptidase